MNNYIPEVDVLTAKVENPPTKSVKMFGKDLIVYDDSWRNHLHVITNYHCNAKCSFCVEKNQTCREFLSKKRLLEVLYEMSNAGILSTVSFSGGEPTLHKEILEMIDIVPRGVFCTMNTNGTNLEILKKSRLDFVNISRHYIDQEKNDRFFKTKTPTLDEIRDFRCSSGIKTRIQSVVNEETILKDMVFEYLGHMVCDDLSIRSLMIDGSEESKRSFKIYNKIIKDSLNLGAEVLQQEVQDYYVYEIHRLYEECDITFSYSNMQMVLEDDTESDIIREFILYPDGELSGSWKRGLKVIS